MSGTVARSAPQRTVEPGAIARFAEFLCKVCGYLLLGLVFSILLEWIGLTFWWPEEGTEHSRAMLARELSYVGESCQTDCLFDRSGLAQQLADRFYHTLFEATGLVTGMQRLHAKPNATDSWLLSVSREIYQPVSTYLVATITITQVYAVRLAVLLFSMPVFVLAGLVGLSDGLVIRDRRRFGGAAETSFVYHHAKRIVVPTVAVAWLGYLASPVSLHPNLLILPAAVLFGLAVAVSAATFKKHL